MLSDAKPLPTLPQICKAGELQEVAFARQVLTFSPIRELDPIEVRGGIGAIISQHAALIGFKGEIDPLNKSDISGMILSRFSSLSLEELYKAFQMERYGEFDTRTEHYQLINAPYVSEILKKYKQWLQRTRQTNNLPMSLPAPSTEEQLTEEEKEARFIANVQQFYNDFKQTGQLPLLCCWIYDGLKERGMVAPFTEEEKELLTKRYRERKLKERDNRSLIKSFKKALEGDDVSLKAEVALEYIFENDKLLIENDK